MQELTNKYLMRLAILRYQEEGNTMTKRIKATEYLCDPTTFDLEDFIIAQTKDAMGNHIMPEDGGMLDEEIDQLRNLAVGESMPLGDPEAGLTIIRLPNKGIKTISIHQFGLGLWENLGCEDIPLHEHLAADESLSPEEMYALNTLEVGQSFELGVHYGYVTFTRTA